MKHDAFVFAALGERGVLGQKPVARMHRFGAAFFANIDNAVDRPDNFAIDGAGPIG